MTRTRLASVVLILVAMSVLGRPEALAPAPSGPTYADNFRKIVGHPAADGIKTENFVIHRLDPGLSAADGYSLKLSVSNIAGRTGYLVVDLRIEGLSFGRADWQKQFCFAVKPGVVSDIEIPYEVLGLLTDRMIIRFGESERFIDFQALFASIKAGEKTSPPPPVKFQAVKVVETDDYDRQAAALKSRMRSHEDRLSPAKHGQLQAMKSQWPEMIKTSRSEGEGPRSELRKLFDIDRPVSASFDYREENWAESGARLNGMLERYGVDAEVFSIAAEGEHRIGAFLAAAGGDAGGGKPLVMLLSGNPPGTKESLVGTAILLCRLGFTAVGIDRRATARVLDKKDKFLPSFADPVFDVIRLLDYLESRDQHGVSGIGLFGFSAGAREGLFVAALDHRIGAAVLAVGLASNNGLFGNKGWFPTYSGMIIFPELGLGEPEIGKLTPEEFWEYFNKLQPEHNALARKAFQRAFPFFEKLDSLKVGPLAAPVPAMIITGARDEQFLTPGVVEVDEAMERAYEKAGCEHGLEFIVQPRSGHTVNREAGLTALSFLERWLK